MSKFIDLTGQELHGWTVVKKHTKRNKHDRILWVCECSCGYIQNISGNRLKNKYGIVCKHCGKSTYAHYQHGYRKNFLGFKIGTWTIIKHVKTTPNRDSHWIGQCECGYTKPMIAFKISRNKISLCIKCDINSSRYDITGKTFGQWTVVKKNTIPVNKRGRKDWLCKCTCGNTRIIQASYLKNGLAKRCVVCAGDIFAWRGCGEISLKYFHNIKRRAKNKNRDFTVTLEQVWNLFLQQNKQCALTGLPLKFTRNYAEQSYLQTASLDRIDSKFGYIFGNLQWIHKDVNMAKHIQSQKYFINMCHLVSTHNRKESIN